MASIQSAPIALVFILAVSSAILFGCEKKLSEIDLQDYDTFQYYEDRQDVPALLLFLNSQSYGMRESAIVALARLNDERAVMPITHHLLDPNPHVANRAARALKTMGDARSADYILQALEDKKQWSKDIIELSGQFADERALDVLKHIRDRARLPYQRKAARISRAMINQRLDTIERQANQDAESDSFEDDGLPGVDDQ